MQETRWNAYNLERVLSWYLVRAASDLQLDKILGLAIDMDSEAITRKIYPYAGGGVRGYLLAGCVLEKAADMMDLDGFGDTLPRLLKLMEVLEL